MKINVTRIVLAAALALAPAAAFARPSLSARPHTPTVHDHAPQAHIKTVSAHR